MGWLRNFIRSRTKPIDPVYAMKMKKRLSIIYAVSAWNAFAILVYMLVKHNYPETEDEKDYPSKYYARLLDTPNAKVVRYSGFTKVDEYEIERTQDPDHDKPWFRIERERRERKEQKEREEREELERKNREDLNLLVEETNSL